MSYTFMLIPVYSRHCPCNIIWSESESASVLALASKFCSSGFRILRSILTHLTNNRQLQSVWVNNGFTFLKFPVSAHPTHAVSYQSQPPPMDPFTRSFVWWSEGINFVLRPLIGLLYRARMIDEMEQLVDWELSGVTEVFGGNLHQCHFVHHKSHTTWPGIESGP
jgi:hypothetical protein